LRLDRWLRSTSLHCGGRRDPHRHGHAQGHYRHRLGRRAVRRRDSFTHVYDLARQHNQPVVFAALLPLAGDGLVAAASAAMLAAVRSGRPAPVRARILLVLGIGATETGEA
jgi:hypothetical protein